MKTHYLSIEETAAKWGKTPRNVRQHCKKGHIPGVTTEGKSWRIPETARDPGHSTRRKQRKFLILRTLLDEKRNGTKNGIYHHLQINFAYDSNHMEGSRLTHDQTRWIYETQTIGSIGPDVPVDDLLEAANHFRCVDMVLETVGAALSETYVKKLHAQLKSGTTDSRKAWFAVGDYKKLDNVVGALDTTPAKDVPAAMAALLARYRAGEKSFENILDFHVAFESIHPFQDGNGRIGRLLLLKECLKYRIPPFIIPDSIKTFYYQGLDDWRAGNRLRLLDTCRTGQVLFAEALQKLGYPV